MAIIKAVKNSHSSITHILNYITKTEKTFGQKLCSAYNCNIDTAQMEMQTTKELYGKTGGRTYKHFIQSFSPEEKNTASQAHEMAKEFIESCPLFSDFEVAYCTHVDKSHIHTHFVVNSVSFVDGHKFQMNKKDLENMKTLNNELCMKHGFSICEIGKRKSFTGKNREGIVAYDTSKYQFLKKQKRGKSNPMSKILPLQYMIQCKPPHQKKILLDTWSKKDILLSGRILTNILLL